jgi:hypothetical protein
LALNTGDESGVDMAGGELEVEVEADGGAGSVFVEAGAAAAVVGSQRCPGFSIKFTVSPSLMLYSLSSFPSASALPLRRRRWASAGGAECCAASWAFIAEIVSVGCTLSVKLAGGFRDLNVSEIEAVESGALWNQKVSTSRASF